MTMPVPAPMKFHTADHADLRDFVTDDDWTASAKLDGIRALLRIRPGKPVEVLSSNGSPLKSAAAGPFVRRIEGTPHFTLLSSRLAEAYGDDDFFIDGEIVCGSLWAFDIVTPGDEHMTLVERMDRLERLQRDTGDTFIDMFINILPFAWTTLAKEHLVTKSLRFGGEGVMFKKYDSPYDWSTRVRHSLKMKWVSTADCIVTDIGLGTSAKKTHGGEVTTKYNLELGLYDKGVLTTVGRTSTLGKGVFSVGDVVEVRYLSYLGPGGRLVQPTIVRTRNDKLTADCTIDQLRITDKFVDIRKLYLP